jgi:LysM repeat protein
MNTPSPLIPQGVTPAKGKTSFFFKVLMILSLHVVVIGGMLLQGCKDTKENPSSTSSQDTASTADTMPPATNPSSVSNASAVPANPPPGAGLPPTAAGQQPPPAPPAAAMAAPTAPPTPATSIPAPPTVETAGKEYLIASGDTLGAIAHRNGVSLKALLEANPGVVPTKLHVGQKIQIPGGTSAPAAGGATSGGMEESTDSSTYVVKSGDTLSKIAKANHTTYKKLMALNDLKTTSIKTGQKLKIPTSKPTAETPVPASMAPVVPTAPVTTPGAPATSTAGGPVTSNQ